METLLYAIAAIVLLALLTLIIVAIRLVRRVETIAERSNLVLQQSQDLLSSLAGRLPPVLDGIEKLSEQATKTLDNADRQLSVLGDALDEFRQVARRINWLEQRLQEKIEGPLMDAAKVVAGVSKAVKTFADVFNRR